MGLNAARRFKDAGADVKKTDVLKFALSALRVVTSGQRKHPRAHLPVDRALVEHIKKHGIPREFFTVREDGDLGEVIDGARRTKAAHVAEKELQLEAPRIWPLEPRGRGWTDEDGPGHLYVEAEVVSCSDLELQLLRLDANARRGLPDSASVLAAIVGNIVRLNKGMPDAALTTRIVEAMPQGVTSGVVIALSRWDELTPELQVRWESGDAPLGLLPVVLAAAVDEREAVLDKALREGVRTAKGATRRANKVRGAKDPWARPMTPRQGIKAAEHLGNTIYGAQSIEGAIKELNSGRKQVSLIAAAVAIGITIASSKDAGALVEQLPQPIADALRKARAAK